MGCKFPAGIGISKPSPTKEQKQGSEDDDGEWRVVGSGGANQVITSDMRLAASPIQQIFGGRLRSILKSQQNPGGSVSMTPFLTLPLDMWEGVENLDKALAVTMG